MSSATIQPKYPGTIQARAYYAEDGEPKLQIEREEMLRLHLLLKQKLKHEPTMLELFDYVYRETQH